MTLGAIALPPTEPPAPELRAVAFADRRRAVLVGDGGIILSSEDGGRRFTQRRPGLGDVGGLTVVAFAGQSGVGWAGGAAGSPAGYAALLLKTTDGGRSWHEQPLGEGSGYWVDRIDAVSPDDVSVLTQAAVLRSRDGGATWQVTLRAAPGERLLDLKRRGEVTYYSTTSGLFRYSDR